MTDNEAISLPHICLHSWQERFEINISSDLDILGIDINTSIARRWTIMKYSINNKLSSSYIKSMHVSYKKVTCNSKGSEKSTKFN